MNPLDQAVKSGIRMNDRISDVIAHIGTGEHPDGYVQVAYRNALRAISKALEETRKLEAVNEVLAQLRDTIMTETEKTISLTQVLGVDEAVRQLGYYGVEVNTPEYDSILMELFNQRDSALDATVARVDAQIAAVRGLVITDAESEMITGDDGHKGVLRASDVAVAATFWATATLWDSFSWWASGNSGGVRFQKQAIAWIDSRTTDCCRRVNGQIRELNEPFHLLGTPRYADYIDWPAFHDYCRTAGVLYQKAYDLGITDHLLSGTYKP